MLAPGLMISACGLLLLSMCNRYSLVVNRIRLLDDEKRKLKIHQRENSLKDYEENRLVSIRMQIIKLSFRIRQVRNAVICYSVAVALFVLSCFSIGMRLLLSGQFFSSCAVILFFGGMICVFIGITYAAMETRKGYEIVQIEIHQE